MKLTHGLITENEHEGIKRGMSLQRFADEQIVKYLISIETTSSDGQVVKTPIQFSEFGFQMFCTFMENAPHDLDNFPITDATSRKTMTTDTRYPYTYAADYVRSLAGYGEHGTKLSRSDASQIRSGIALALGMDDDELARRLADYYKANEDAELRAIYDAPKE